jgi:hypothetical protein
VITLRGRCVYSGPAGRILPVAGTQVTGCAKGLEGACLDQAMTDAARIFGLQ